MKLLIKGVELNGVATDIYIENKYIKQIGPRACLLPPIK